MQHRCPRHQRGAINWASYVLQRGKKYVILDTETTGLGKTDEIVQLAVIAMDGSVLFNENIKPTKRKRMSREASEIHGLTMKILKDCPTFRDLRKPLKQAIGRRTIITYNAEFDERLVRQTRDLAGGFFPRGIWDCAMLQYARFVGQWNHYYGNYRWHKLQGGDHTALGDCLATLDLIRTMAAATKLKRWYEFWTEW